MEENNKIVIIEEVSLTGLFRWMQETFKIKKTGIPFTISDIQGYINRKRIPMYLGGYEVKTIKRRYCMKKYSVINHKKVADEV